MGQRGEQTSDGVAVSPVAGEETQNLAHRLALVRFASWVFA